MALPLFIHVDPSSGTPIYQQMVDSVSRAVASGVLVAGEALPSVRELSLALSVNFNTVVHAFQRLQDLGLVESRRGVGLFVANGAAKLTSAQRLARLETRTRELLVAARQLGLTEDEVVAQVRKLWNERKSHE